MLVKDKASSDITTRRRLRTEYINFLTQKQAVIDNKLIKANLMAGSGGSNEESEYTDLQKGALYFTPEERNELLTTNSYTQQVDMGVITEGLIAYFNAGRSSSYPGHGDSWYNLAGPQHMTLYNPGFTAAKGGAVVFNGTDTYGTMDDIYSDLSNGFTAISICDFGGTSTWERIFDFGNGEADNNLLFARDGSTNSLRLDVYDDNNNQSFVASSAISNYKNIFYGVAIDGSTCKMYKNGSEIGTDDFPYLPTNVSRDNIYIGRSNWVADNYFERSMSVFMFYNRCLTPNEILYNYTALKTKFTLDE